MKKIITMLSALTITSSVMPLTISCNSETTNIEKENLQKQISTQEIKIKNFQKRLIEKKRR